MCSACPLPKQGLLQAWTVCRRHECNIRRKGDGTNTAREPESEQRQHPVTRISPFKGPRPPHGWASVCWRPPEHGLSLRDSLSGAGASGPSASTGASSQPLRGARLGNFVALDGGGARTRARSGAALGRLSSSSSGCSSPCSSCFGTATANSSRRRWRVHLTSWMTGPRDTRESGGGGGNETTRHVTTRQTRQTRNKNGRRIQRQRYV